MHSQLNRSVSASPVRTSPTPRHHSTFGREAILETRALGSQTTGSVVAVGIRQASDVYLDRAFFSANSNRSAASQYDSELQSVEELFNDLGSTGLSDSLDAIFQSFEQLSARPNDKTVRAELLNRLDVFASRVREIGDSLASKKNRHARSGTQHDNADQ